MWTPLSAMVARPSSHSCGITVGSKRPRRVGGVRPAKEGRGAPTKSRPRSQMPSLSAYSCTLAAGSARSHGVSGDIIHSLLLRANTVPAQEMSQGYVPSLSMGNCLRSEGPILQAIEGEGCLSPEVGNNLRGIGLFIQITGIPHTTEFDDHHRAEIEEKRTRLTTAYIAK